MKTMTASELIKAINAPRQPIADTDKAYEIAKGKAEMEAQPAW